VLVKCGDPDQPKQPVKKATKQVQRGDTIEYEIGFGGEPDPLENQEVEMLDPLPEALFAGTDDPDVEVHCTLGACGFDPVSLTVFWYGMLEAGQVAIVTFDVHVPVEGPPLPPEIINCATYYDSSGAYEGCATTEIVTADGLSEPQSYWTREHAVGLTAT
jgi:hypothetical protein